MGLNIIMRCTAFAGDSKEEFFMNSKTKTLVMLAMLEAILILMAFTPIGYLKIGIVEITFLTIPVIVGAVTLGPAAGAILGGTFGLTSFIQAFGMSTFGIALLAVNPINTFILCFVPRLLMGYLCGLIFKAMYKKSNSYKLPAFTASLAGPVLNTVLFTSTLMLLFGSCDYILGLRGGADVFSFMVAFVGINGLIEAVVCCIVGTAVSAAILKYMKR